MNGIIMNHPTYRPLADEQIRQIHEAALQVLSKTGLRCTYEPARSIFEGAGADVDSDRIRIPEAVVEKALDTCPSELVLCGRDPEHDLRIGGTRVHMGTGGAALDVVDPHNGTVRRGQLDDVANLALLVDNLEHIEFYLRPTEPQDIPDEITDVNKYYAALTNTTKHVMAGINTADGLEDVFELASMIAGGPEALRERPFVSIIACWMVSPLKIDPHTTELLLRTVELGLPAVVCSAPMAGATSPMTLAGTLVQINAELLSGIVLTQAAKPGAPVLYGAVPSTSNMRNGAYIGGSPEFGMMNAAAAQLAHFYEVPIYNSAGLTDSKCSDIQAGYEKGFSVLQAALAGSNFIHHAAGLLEAMSTIAYEQFVIDNEILGMARRCIEGIDLSDLDAAVEAIDRSAPGGNYLMDELTLEKMRTELYDVTISDRQSRRDWEDAGTPDIVQAARQRALDILSTAEPPGLDPDIDTAIRDRFDIRC